MQRLNIFLPGSLEELKSYLWSLPERVWLALKSGEALHLQAQQEDLVWRSYHYLWLFPGQLIRCRDLFGTRSFLLDLMDNVYRPLLAAGRYAPFPVVVYLAIGYNMSCIEIPTRVASHSIVLANYLNALNRWLQDILRYEYLYDPDLGDVQRAKKRRADWVRLNQFIRRAISSKEIGPNLAHLPMDPSVCDNQVLRDQLWHPDAALIPNKEHRPIESRLEESLPPTRQFRSSPEIDAYLSESTLMIDRRFPVEKQRTRAVDETLHKAWQQQTRAVRYYLGRAGIRYLQGQNNQSFPHLSGSEEQALDLVALAGYQAFGKFIPDDYTTMLLERLRLQINDATVMQRAQQSTVEGIARRGSISQVLKWQLTLKDKGGTLGNAYVYDRYLNHHLLYLKRVSQRSQELSLTLLIIIDLSADSFKRVAEDRCYHSLAREVCAHLLQDCYQVLWRIPKLYADAVVLVHNGQRIVWKSGMVLTDGSGTNPAAEDIFLKYIPPWLSDESEFDDPATFFQYMLPPLLDKSIKENLQENIPPLEEQIVDMVNLIRRLRISWLGSLPKNKVVSGGLLPVADILVTVNAPSAPFTNRQIEQNYETLHGLGLLHQLWVLNPGERFSFKRLSSQGDFMEYPFRIEDFQLQRRGKDTKLSVPPVRQAFIHEVLNNLLVLCTGVEVI